MIHPVDVPVLFAERRRFFGSENGTPDGPLRRNAYGQCVTSKMRSPVLPQVVRQRGVALWNNLFKETSRLPMTREELVENSSNSQGSILFPDPVEPPSNQSPLELQMADLHVEANAIAHHTADFDVVRRANDKKLVIRRGQPFSILLLFYRDIEADVDEVKLVFETGSQPMVSNCTRAIVTLSLKEGIVKENEQRWWAKVKKLSGSQLDLELQVSPNCLVGRWNLKVVTSLTTAPRSEYQNSTSLIRDVYIFFNPWNKDDIVYMPTEDVEEYVLNDVGKIWRGGSSFPLSVYWSFGQFEEGVLEACINVLNKSALPYPMRSSPAQVVRAMTDMIQSPEEYSILEGLWSTDFFIGTAPTEWTGSAKILQQYAKTGHRISYGHCWVFAGVMTTICRCFGIPTRIVTCYQAAHDSDKLISVDMHVDRSGKINEDESQDKIWAYHVWNECWMKRPDIGCQFDGWQVVDSTPQEKGGGFTRIGPTPVRAVKEGRIDILHDTANVICEANADKCYWVEDDIGEEHLVKVVKNGTGLLLSTKRPGRQFMGFSNEDRMDLTQDYKLDPDKRTRIFESMLPGYQASLSAYLKDKPVEDVKFELEMNQGFTLGDDMHFKVLIVNTSDRLRSVNLSLRVESVHFTGRNDIKVKQELCKISLSPKEKYEFTSVVLLNDYLTRSGGQFSFMAILRAVIDETKQIFLELKDFSAKMPSMEIKPLEQLRVGDSSTIELTFHNPLPVTLTGCKFIVDGPGILEAVDVSCKNLPPRATAKARYDVKPFRARENAVIIAHFSCDQLKDVTAAIGTCVKS